MRQRIDGLHTIGGFVMGAMLMCGISTAATVEMLRSPEVPEAMSYKSIAIGDVRGNGGAAVAQEIESMLMRSGAGAPGVPLGDARRQGRCHD